MTPGELSNQAPDPGPCSILLVEDNPLNQKVVHLMLGKFGITPTMVDRGEQALEAIGRSRFDLILMDLHMPGMNGMETTSRIRQVLGEDCPPIVALTADVVPGIEASVLEQGMDGFLTKPISFETLKACVQEYIGITL